jgi:glycine/D-amino acid oxidase-like deaminating enzyme
VTGSSVIVVGAGAWGLPAALRLQDRGHVVTLIDRFETGGPFASNGGSSRLWRVADTKPWRARSLVDAVAAMERLGDRLGAPVFRQTGMVWRDDLSLPDVVAAMSANGGGFERVEPDRVGEVFPGLRPDGREALFVERAGVVHADALLDRALAAFRAAGGVYLPNSRVRAVTPAGEHAAVRLENGDVHTADQVLVAAGPGTPEILPGLGLWLPLRPYIEQVAYFDAPGAPDLPGLVDCGIGDDAGVYAMSDGPTGYKVGLDLPLRALADDTLGDDLDRSADPVRTESIRARVERDLTAVVPNVLASQVCTWTDSSDGDFIIGRTHPSVVLACGDSGEGFKYAAFMGEYLADLVEGGEGDAEFQSHWTFRRFGADAVRSPTAFAIGRH